MQVIKKEVREHTTFEGAKVSMWFYLVHYMVRCLGEGHYSSVTVACERFCA